MADSLSSTVRTLISTLSSSSAHRGALATQLASDLYSLCVESVSDTELAYCSSVLFHKDSGILHFLKESATLDEFSSCQEQLLNLLESYVKTHRKLVLQYTTEIKEVCNSLFSRNKSSKVKNAIFPPLLAVLEVCAQTSKVESLNLPKMAEKFMQASMLQTKHTSTVRSSIYHLLGRLCELYPEVMMGHSEKLIDIYMRTLKSEMVGSKAKKKPDMPVIGGVLKGLCSYLVNFSQSVAEGSAHAQNIYKFTCMAMDPAVSHTRYEVPRAGLSLIASHAAQFKEYLAKDHQHMYECISEWTSHVNRDNRKIALSALEAFFQQVATHVKENAAADRAANLAIFKFLVQKFRAIIDDKSSDHAELALAVKGYGYFAAPCKIFMKAKDVSFMFNEIAQRTEQLFFAPTETMDSRLVSLPSFLAALGSIVREMDELSDSFVHSLEKLMALFFECYPGLEQMKMWSSLHMAVLNIIIGIASSSRTTLKTFLTHIVFQGVAVSCSHPPVVDVGEEGAVVHVEGGDTDILGRKKGSYLSYVPLWVALLHPTHLKGPSLHYLDPAARKALHQIIYDEFISTIFKIVCRLDLSSQPIDHETPGGAPSHQAQDRDSSSPASTEMTSNLSGTLQPPSVLKDFHVLINLVDLCKAVLPKVELGMFEKWVYTFGREVILFSSRHPLISSFYKLLAIDFSICKGLAYFKGIDDNSLAIGGPVATDVVPMETDSMETSAVEEDVKDKSVCFILFRKFIKEVLVQMRQYKKGDLLASCLQLLLCLPIELVQLELNSLVPALQTTFKLGLSYPPLAHAGLDALERWSKELPAHILTPHFKHILPHLDDYLQTVGSARQSEGGNGGTINVQKHTRRGRNAPVKIIAQWKEGVEGAESPLNQLRRRIVFFLGSLGGHVNSCLVETGPAAAHAAKMVAWDSKSNLEFALPFQDMKPAMFLDSFLPRVCELATTSSDRQTKIVACELLHALVLFIIGKSAQPAATQKSPMTNLFKKLFPYVLELGCDVEDVAEQLFRPLLFQMIHWFTRNTQYESPDTIALLDAILEGVAHPTDGSLRNFSASCLKEFLVWSIKQTTKKMQEKSPINTKSLLKRLYSMALHPSASKRLGAALAINSIYTVFREEESLVDVFVLEMLTVMIASLRLAHKDNKLLGTQDQISQAIDHITRIIRVKAPLLCKLSKKRRIPRELDREQKEADVSNLMVWLLGQCGSPETACRVKCRQMFTDLAPHLPTVLSAMVWIRRTVESEGGSYFISVFEMGAYRRGGIHKQPELGGSVFSLSEAVGWLEALAAALDSYNWVLGEEFVAAKEVFTEQPIPPQSCLFRSLEFFINNLSLQGLEAAGSCFDYTHEAVFSPREREEYESSKCNLILYLLEFVGILVNHHWDTPTSGVPVSLWSEQLFNLLASCCLQPASGNLGFIPSQVETSRKLAKLVQETLMYMAKSPNPNTKAMILKSLSAIMKADKSCDLVGQLPLQLHGGERRLLEDSVQLSSSVSAHLLLQRAGLLTPLIQEMSTLPAKEVPLKLLDSVVSTLRPLASSGRSCDQLSASQWDTLSPGAEETCGKMLELALEAGLEPQVLLSCLLDLNDETADVGLLVYHSFSTIINTHIVSIDYQHFLLPLLGSCNKKPDNVVAILGSLLEQVHREKSLKRKHGSKLVAYLLRHWGSFSSWWEGPFVADRQLAALGVLKRMFAIDPEFLTRAVSSADSAPSVEQVFNMYCALVDERSTSLTFKGKVFEVLHHFAALPDPYDSRLKSTVQKMVSHQFPLKSSEFKAGTPQYNEYISCLDKFLRGLVQSGSLSLLDVLVGIMCRETRHTHEEHIQSCLQEFLDKLTPAKSKTAMDLVYNMLTNEQGYPPEARRAAGERVCLPLLRSCDLVALREFFLDHIAEIMQVVEASLSKTGVDLHLTLKLCCFQLMEVLYSRLPAGALSNPESSIIKAYCRGKARTGKELTQAITKASHSAKCEDLRGDKTHYELRRQYHCAAYKTLIAVISCTQNKMQFYFGFLFKEDLGKGQYLWENLVDLDKEYQFAVEFDQPLSRKKQMTSIRDEIRSAQASSRESSPMDTPPFAPRYLSSQYLADSSLSTDVSQYDFSTGTKAFPNLQLSQTTEEPSTYVLSEEELEQDDLNQHECMLTLMKLLDHMEHNKINPEVPTDTFPSEMPLWMSALHKKFNEGQTHRNVRIFLARLICNRSKLFQPYAKNWVTPLVQLIVGGESGGVGLHYFAVDVMVTILSWQATAAAKNITIMEDSYLANRLLSYLMEHCSHDNRAVLQNNLEIIKTLVESWKLLLQPSSKVIFDRFVPPSPDSKEPRTGIQLLGIVLANGLPPFDPANAGSVTEQKFFSTFVSLLSCKYKQVFEAAAEVVGLILAYFEEHQHYSLDNMKTLVVQRLRELADSRNEDKFLTSLHKIQISYSKLTSCFVEKLLFLLPNFHGVFRSMCLEVLLPQADIFPTLYVELRDKGLHDMLTHRDEPVQTAALKLVQGMVQHHTLSDQQMSDVIPLVTKFGGHSSESCRLLMYETLIVAYGNILEAEGDSPSDEDLKSVLNKIRDQLLQGLSDDAEAIRLKMYSFWNEESRLSSDTLGRLTQLLAVLYSANTERQFLYHSTNLLLELTSRSPDFNRSIFDSPLSECKFEDYAGIDLSWQQRHLQMTPLYAATQASQSASPDEQTQGGGARGGVLRATQQSLAFTPTQDVGGYNWMAPSMQSLDPSSSSLFTAGSTQDQSSALLFKKPSRRPSRPLGPNFGKEFLRPSGSASQDASQDSQDEIKKLKRRFVRDKKYTSSFFARTSVRKKIMREEHHKHQRAARDSKVVMYRKYRVGELPDIQIKHSELIRPFQALAQHDSSLARMLFTLLYKAVFQQVDRMLPEAQAAQTNKAVVKDAMNLIMTESSTHFHPPFIGSLQEICYHEKQLELEPAAVSRAALTSRQEPIGIMLLEKQLLSNTSSVTQPTPAKRARKVTSPLPEGVALWVELSKLYKSLGDYDVVRGIFGGHVGTKPVTKDALEAEERVDYREALAHYTEALKCEQWSDGMEPTQVEEDLWYDSLLSCYHQLTDWEGLEKAAITNVDSSHTPPRLNMIWEDDYHAEHYLPYIIRSKVKLACSGRDDPLFSKFLDDAMLDTHHKNLLESEYSAELALYSILRDNLDRARYYSNVSLQAFLRDWSDMDKLLVSSRTSRLQSLQALTEMQEYITFRSESGNFESTHAVERLLKRWRSRLPHPQSDSVNVWDDIVTGRCMMMRKLLEHFHTLPQAVCSMSDSEDPSSKSVDLSSLQSLFSLEFTKLYLKIADSARQQYNYAVTTKYLQLTEAAITEHFPSDISLHLEWLHSVAEMRLQQAIQDPSPPKISPMVSLVERFDGYTSQSVLKTAHSLACKHHLLEGSSYSLLAKAFREEGGLLLEVFSDRLMEQLRKVLKVPATMELSVDQISHKLLLRAMATLKDGVKSGTSEFDESGKQNSQGMVSALNELASFCDRELRLKEEEDMDSPLDVKDFPSVVVVYTLKAMQNGCQDATRLVPRLLQIVDLYPDTLEHFKKKCRDIPCWMFISWLSQLVALLDKPEGPAVHDILFSMATEYPQALSYPLKISASDYKFDASTAHGRANKEAVEKLKSKIKNELLDNFVAALELLCSPELVIKDYLDNEVKPIMESSVVKRDKKKLNRIWREIHGQLQGWKEGSSTSSLYGEETPSVEIGMLQKNFAKDNIGELLKKFGKDGSLLLKMDLREYKSVLGKIHDRFQGSLRKTTGNRLLKEYSPWLSGFQGNQHLQTIEIPGQYDGLSKPLPEYHTKISGFDEKVLVMSSLRKPKRLTIRGDDERDHMFLVKGGEDLRLDQRVEQLYCTMNQVLDEDPACSQRGLRLRIYKVVPMTCRVGIIEWMKNTTPLKDFLKNALDGDNEMTNYLRACALHNEWLKKNYEEKYTVMYKKAKPTEVETQYRKKVSYIPRDLLRRAFLRLSASPEAFLVLRSHCLRTLAALSMCQYVIGIGDRHLSNFMVDLESGGIIGIDFGHNFGTATQFLPYPELMPFRLTPQFTNLLLPHTEGSQLRSSGQLRSCMVHTLRALRNSQQLLLNMMDVFVKEPALDWKSLARKQAKSQKKSQDSASEEGSWYPVEKIKTARKKLQGYNPAHVMLVDLKNGHEKSQEFSALKAILMGDRKFNKRAQVGERCTTVEEQVACLVDHATDPNILGRTYGGWEPWV